MGWREWLGLSPALPATRVEGRPPSGNGASSFHLFWQVPPHEPLCQVSVTFELLNEPRQNRLYFWALQAGFADSNGAYGGGHFGFQWHPDYPGMRQQRRRQQRRRQQRRRQQRGSQWRRRQPVRRERERRRRERDRRHHQ